MAFGGLRSRAMKSPTGVCSKCGKELCIESLRSLPEIEDYSRGYALSQMSGGVPPKAPDTRAMIKKYGYTGGCLFCDECLGVVVSEAKSFDNEC